MSMWLEDIPHRPTKLRKPRVSNYSDVSLRQSVDALAASRRVAIPKSRYKTTIFKVDEV